MAIFVSDDLYNNLKINQLLKQVNDLLAWYCFTTTCQLCGENVITKNEIKRRKRRKEDKYKSQNAIIQNKNHYIVRACKVFII